MEVTKEFIKKNVLTPEEMANNAIIWINRLATTSVKQGKSELGNSQTGYCCLGYGCMISKISYQYDDGFNSDFAHKVGLLEEEGTFYEEIQKGFSLEYWQERVVRGLCYDRTTEADSIKINTFNNLAEFNDSGKYSFRKISTIMKKYPRNIFIPPVAEIIEQHFKK